MPVTLILYYLWVFTINTEVIMSTEIPSSFPQRRLDSSVTDVNVTFLGITKNSLCTCSILLFWSIFQFPIKEEIRQSTNLSSLFWYLSLYILCKEDLCFQQRCIWNRWWIPTWMQQQWCVFKFRGLHFWHWMHQSISQCQWYCKADDFNHQATTSEGTDISWIPTGQQRNNPILVNHHLEAWYDLICCIDCTK